MSQAAADVKAPAEPGAQFIVTRWGTLVYCDASGELRHGDIWQVPRNVCINHGRILTSPGHASEPVELSGIAAGRLTFIRRNTLFCTAETDGKFTAACVTPSGWQQFLLIGEAELDVYREFQTNDWSLRDGSVIMAGDIKILVDFKLKFGSRTINLAMPDALIATARASGRIAEIRAIHDDWKIISARRFAPLIYVAVFGKDHIFEMLKLCLDSIHRYGDYVGHICILSDRPSVQLKSYIPDVLLGRTRFIFRDVTDHASMMMERFDIAGLPIEDFQPILCLDADMICDAPLMPMLALCNTAPKFFGSAEYAGAPLATLHAATRDWFGQFLFDAAGLSTEHVYCLNGGAIGFPNRDFAAPVFAQIKSAFAASQRAFPDHKRMGEQPILNYILQEQNLIDARALNKFIRFRYQHFKAADARLGLVHFNYGPGADKMDHMRDYLAVLAVSESKRSK